MIALQALKSGHCLSNANALPAAFSYLRAASLASFNTHAGTF